MPLRLLYFGTPAFAVPSLVALAGSAHPVVGVVTQPDRPRGRGQKVVPEAVKLAAIDTGTPGLPADAPQGSRAPRRASGPRTGPRRGRRLRQDSARRDPVAAASRPDQRARVAAAPLARRRADPPRHSRRRRHDRRDDHACRAGARCRADAGGRAGRRSTGTKRASISSAGWRRVGAGAALDTVNRLAHRSRRRKPPRTMRLATYAAPLGTARWTDRLDASGARRSTTRFAACIRGRSRRRRSVASASCSFARAVDEAAARQARPGPSSTSRRTPWWSRPAAARSACSRFSPRDGPRCPSARSSAAIAIAVGDEFERCRSPGPLAMTSARLAAARALVAVERGRTTLAAEVDCGSRRSRRAGPRVPPRGRRRHAALAERARRLSPGRSHDSRSRRSTPASAPRCVRPPTSFGTSTASRRTPSCTNRSRSFAPWAHRARRASSTPSCDRWCGAAHPAAAAAGLGLRDRAAALTYLTVTLSHPEWLADRWLTRYGFEAAERWCQFNNAAAATRGSCRRWPIRAGVARAAARGGRRGGTGCVRRRRRAAARRRARPPRRRVARPARRSGRSVAARRARGRAPSLAIACWTSAPRPAARPPCWPRRWAARACSSPATIAVRRVALLDRDASPPGRDVRRCSRLTRRKPLPFGPVFDRRPARRALFGPRRAAPRSGPEVVASSGGCSRRSPPRRPRCLPAAAAASGPAAR